MILTSPVYWVCEPSRVMIDGDEWPWKNDKEGYLSRTHEASPHENPLILPLMSCFIVFPADETCFAYHEVIWMKHHTTGTRCEPFNSES